MNKDTRDILDRAYSTGGPFVLATVTRTEGSSYRRPGARMLIGASGRVAGSVSGGCLERDLVRRAVWLVENGPRVLRFTTAADPDENELHYLGCGGAVEVLVEPATVDLPGALGVLRWIDGQRAPAAMATVTSSDARGLPIGARFAATALDHCFGLHGEGLSRLCETDVRDAVVARRGGCRRYAVGDARIDVVIEHIAPTRELLIAGRHHDVSALVALAGLQGWRTTVAAAGTRPGRLGDPDDIIELSPSAARRWAAGRAGAAAVIMTHSLALDRELLAVLLHQDQLAYLGLLGPRHRADDLLAELARRGDLPAFGTEHLRAPVGLELGGDGPEAVALSIAADLQVTWSERRGARECRPALTVAR